jgi:hypothetical protein
LPPDTAPILITAVATVEVPFEVARARLTCDPTTLLAIAVEGKEPASDQPILGRLGPLGPRGPGAQPVEVDVIGARELGDRAVLAMRWQTQHAQGMTAHFEGEVLLAPLGASSCQLRICGALLWRGGALEQRPDLHQAPARTIEALAHAVAEAIESLDSKDPGHQPEVFPKGAGS